MKGYINNQIIKTYENVIYSEWWYSRDGIVN